MYDIWKKQTINELEMYEPRKLAERNIYDQLRELKAALTSIRSPGADAGQGKGGGGSADDRYLNNIVKQELLEENLRETKRALKRMNHAMEVLSEEEKEILDCFFINPEKEAAFNLADKLNIDRKTVYLRREIALKKLTVAMYGKT